MRSLSQKLFLFKAFLTLCIIQDLRPFAQSLRLPPAHKGPSVPWLLATADGQGSFRPSSPQSKPKKQKETLALTAPGVGDRVDLPQSFAMALWGCKCLQQSQKLCVLGEGDPNLYQSYVWQTQYEVRLRQWFVYLFFFFLLREKVTCKKHHAVPGEVTHSGVLCSF